MTDVSGLQHALPLLITVLLHAPATSSLPVQRTRSETHKMRLAEGILNVQAKAVAEHLKEYDIQRVYVSPFYR